MGLQQGSVSTQHKLIEKRQHPDLPPASDSDLKKTGKSMNEIALLLLIGLTAGVISGVLGLGGGIVVIPALVTLLSFSQLKAQGTSMGLLMLPIGVFAVINYYKAGYVDIKAVPLMAVTFLLGSYFSSKFIVSIPEDMVKKIFAVFLLLYSMKLFLNK